MNWQYLYLLFQSNLLEIVVFFFFYRKYMSWKRIVLLVSVSNAITHPIVIFVLLRNTSFSFLTGILIAELFAIVMEAIFHQWDKKLAFSTTVPASTLANLVSWQLGPVLTTLIFMRDYL